MANKTLPANPSQTKYPYSLRSTFVVYSSDLSPYPIRSCLIGWIVMFLSLYLFIFQTQLELLPAHSKTTRLFCSRSLAIREASHIATNKRREIKENVHNRPSHDALLLLLNRLFIFRKKERNLIQQILPQLIDFKEVYCQIPTNSSSNSRVKTNLVHVRCSLVKKESR